MTRVLGVIVLILGAISVGALAHAALSEKAIMEVVDQQYSSTGVSAQFQFNDSISLLVITVDQDAFQKSLPMLIKRGLLGANTTERDLLLRPYSEELSAALLLSAVCLEPLYINLSNLDNSQVMLFFANRNSYGQTVRRLGGQFFFDRKLAVKIDWVHLDYRNLVIISRDWQAESWLLDATNAEMKFWRPK